MSYQIFKIKLNREERPSRVKLRNALDQFRVIETDKVETAATDGVVILVNPEFFGTLDFIEQCAVILHEIMHVRLNHPNRFKDSSFKSQSMANVAMDYEINSILKRASYTLPDGCLLPEQKGYPDFMSWEYYANLIGDSDEPDESGEGDGQGEGGESEGGESDGKSSGQGEGDVSDGCHASGELAKEFAPDLYDEEQVEETVENISDDLDMSPTIEDCVEDHQGRMRGSSHIANPVSAADGKIIALDSESRWQDIVIETFRPDGEDDLVDWSRRSRRGRQQPEMFLPAQREVNGLKLALVIDISGSVANYLDMWRELAKELVEEVPAIAELEIITHDTDVVDHEHWSRNDGDVDDCFEMKYGGGTDHSTVIPYASALDVDGIVLFTDGETRWGERPDQLVLTVLTPCASDYYACPFGANVKASRK